MKQQNPIQEEDRSTTQTRRKLVEERLFETVRAVRRDNEGVDPDAVLADVTEAVEAVRKEEASS